MPRSAKTIPRNGIAAEERGELHDGEQAMAEIWAELEARPSVESR